MNSAIERLLTLRVTDVMSKDVVSVSSRDTMTYAARTLVEHSISGVPVVDSQRACAGMLSALDFVKRQAGGSGTSSRSWSDEDDESENVGGDELVCRNMTPTVQTIGANQSLLMAARMMCAEHIHRLPVIDEGGRTVGIVTALDLVAALVNAIEE